MQIVLSDQETDILGELLAAYLPQLRREVARTDQHELRHVLVQRQDLAERLLEQISTRTP